MNLVLPNQQPYPSKAEILETVQKLDRKLFINLVNVAAIIDMLEKKGICTKEELRASVETFINHDAKQPE